MLFMFKLLKVMGVIYCTLSNQCVLCLDCSRAVAKWVPQELKLHATYKAARVDKMKLDRFWFYETMQKIMLKDKPKGWEVWRDDDKVRKANSSWFHGNGKCGGSGGIVGRFCLSYAFILEISFSCHNDSLLQKKDVDCIII